MAIDHWMMFSTFAEQRHFIYPSVDSYDGVIINANMATHAPDGLASFLLEKTQSLPYIIDPLTHAFQHDPYLLHSYNTDTHELKPKRAILNMALQYGKPILDKLTNKQPVLPSDFQDDTSIQNLVEKCLHFQRNVLAGRIKDNPNVKYLDLESLRSAPYALVAPYFYMTEGSLSEWLPICRRSAELAAGMRLPNERIFASIVVSQGIVLDEDAVRAIASAFSPIALDGYLIWVDNLDESQAGGAELKGLLALARGLRRNGERSVLNLHGGYFSVLSSGNLGGGAFSGVTHGPEFGECRSVVPVGGGIPISKYYMPLLHARMKYRDALRLIVAKKWVADSNTFYTSVCHCPECQQVIGSDVRNFVLFGESTTKEFTRKGTLTRMEYPTAAAKGRCLNHYLNRKRIEYRMASDWSSEALIDDLKKGVDELRPVLGTTGVDHLTIWQDVLTGKR